jgi:acyl-CoA reductase-like NAD-dependent aldehyde dehydrogenase
VWSGNVERGTQVVRELESGTGWVNQHMDVTPFAPFGGAKSSGIGYENGRWGYEAFTELQVVNTRKA